MPDDDQLFDGPDDPLGHGTRRRGVAPARDDDEFVTAEPADDVTGAHELDQAVGDALQHGLQEMGLELFAADGYRLPELTTVKVPAGVDSARVRGYLLDRYDIEIGAGVKQFASSVWRIGLMGPNANPGSVALILAALKDAIDRA